MMFDILDKQKSQAAILENMGILGVFKSIRVCEDAAARYAYDEWLVRRRMKNELNFPPNFERLVLGCIDADFCK